MRRYSLVVVLLASSVCFVACNQGSDSGDPAPAPDSQPASEADATETTTLRTPSSERPSPVQVSPAAQHVKASDPAVAVESFLTALQNEEGDTAFALITTKARQAMHDAGLSPQPVGSKSASYTVGRTEFVTPEKDGAYVSSIWSEPLGGGEVDQYEIVWVLRKEVMGWRIAGMASEVLPSQPPLFLDFENPAEMQRKLIEAERTIAAANQGLVDEGPQVRQAQNIEPPTEPALNR